MLDVGKLRRLDDTDESAFGESATNHWGKTYDSSQNEFGGSGRGLSDGWTGPGAGVPTPLAQAAPDPVIVRKHCWQSLPLLGSHGRLDSTSLLLCTQPGWCLISISYSDSRLSQLPC